MSIWINQRQWALVAILFILGCGEDASSPTTESNSEPTQPVNAEVPPTFLNKETLHQSFEEATRKGAPQSALLPPTTTKTGKSVGLLYIAVKQIWPKIRFLDENDKPIHYTAHIETDQGNIEIALRPDWAPNHVRNFIALAKVGYYNGLAFDRIHHEDFKLDEGVLEHVEAGCLLGTGEAGGESIGYWLKRESTSTMSHEEGTVGACRGNEDDTAACKFYITLSKAPYLDQHYTLFGKVTRGLNVVRRIYLQPVILDDRDQNGSRRPLEPVIMKKVTIRNTQSRKTRTE